MNDAGLPGRAKWIGRLLTPAALLIALPCLLLFPLFTGACLLPANLLKDVFPWRTGNPNDLVPWNVLQFDGITQFYPWRFFAAQTWRTGYVPLWNPHQFCGTPFLANGQSAVLYPPNLLFALIPVKFAFGVSDLLHLMFTGLTAYLFFRRAGGSSRWASAIGAMCWQLSTWQVSWITLPTFLDTSSWLPSALLAVFYLAKRPGSTRALLLSAVVAMMILAGHLQIAFYCLLLTTSYAVYLVVSRKIAFTKWLKAAAAAAAATLLLAAAQLLPTVELSKLSARGGSAASMSGYAAYASQAMPYEQTAALFVPGFFGHPEAGSYWEGTPYPENAGYLGVFGLLLACVSLFRLRRPEPRIFFAGAALIVLLIALGTPLNMLLYFGVPGFAATGMPARILVLWTFAAAFLASQGADDVLNEEKWVWTGVASYILFGVAVVGVVLALLMKRDHDYLAFVQSDLRLFVGLTVGGAALLWLLVRKTLPAKWAGPLIAALLAADLIAVNFSSVPFVQPADVYPNTPAISWLQQHEAYDRIMPLNTHWSNVDPPEAVLPPNAATVYGLFDTQGYDSLQTRAYREFTNELDGTGDVPPENGNITFTFVPGSNYSRAADGRYLVSLTSLSGFGPALITDGPVSVYQDGSARPIGGNAQLVRVTATRELFESESSFNAAIQNYPGWKQFIGDYAIRAGEADSTAASPAVEPLKIGVRMHAANEVELRYQPSSFLVGLYLSLLGSGWITAQFVLALLRRFRTSAALSLSPTNG